jgi:pantoate--beta-alanine ligase
MSSRNVRLDSAARQQALALSAALTHAERAVASGERDAEVLLDLARDEMTSRGVQPEYLEIVSVDTLSAVDQLQGEALMAVAAFVGGVRLIDNTVLRPI